MSRVSLVLSALSGLRVWIQRCLVLLARRAQPVPLARLVLLALTLRFRVLLVRQVVPVLTVKTVRRVRGVSLAAGSVALTAALTGCGLSLTRTARHNLRVNAAPHHQEFFHDSSGQL